VNNLEVLEYERLVAAWKALRGRADGLSVREVACVHAARTLLVAESAAAGRPVISLAAGVHGDEPAAPWALLSIVRDGLLDSRFAYRIWPCTNPSGYVAGTRENADGDDINRSFSRGGTTPESRAIITANRDRTFALSLDLHEDYESSGFYCYEPKSQIGDGLGVAVLEAVRDAGFALQEMQDGYDLGYPPQAHATLLLEPVQRVHAQALGAARHDLRVSARLRLGRSYRHPPHRGGTRDRTSRPARLTNV
jgi:hypothetical protein